jgi:hypothetical protein
MINLMSLARSETRSRKGRTKTSGERWRAKDFSNREAFYFLPYIFCQGRRVVAGGRHMECAYYFAKVVGIRLRNRATTNGTIAGAISSRWEERRVVRFRIDRSL